MRVSDQWTPPMSFSYRGYDVKKKKSFWPRGSRVIVPGVKFPQSVLIPWDFRWSVLIQWEYTGQSAKDRTNWAHYAMRRVRRPCLSMFRPTATCSHVVGDVWDPGTRWYCPREGRVHPRIGRVRPISRKWRVRYGSFGIPWSQNVHLGTCSLEATSPRIEDDLAMRPARDTSYSRYLPSFTRWASDRRFTYRFKRSHKQQQQQYSEAPPNNAENIHAYLGYFEVVRMSRPHGSTLYHRRRKRRHEEQQQQ